MKFIIRQYFLFIVLIISISTGWAQSRVYFNNEVGIEYTTALTKTFFDKNIEEQFLGTAAIREVYNSKKPTSPLIGYFLGISYSRKIRKDWALFIKLRHTVRGQKSPNFYNYFGRKPSDYQPNYGGLSYTFKVTTNELILGGSKQYFNRGKVNLLFGIGIIVNVYNDAKFQIFLIERENGIKRVSLGAAGFYAGNLDYFDRLNENIKQNHFRYGISVTNEFQYIISKRIAGAIGIELTALSKILSNSKEVGSSVLQGQLLSTGLSIGAKWRL